MGDLLDTDKIQDSLFAVADFLQAYIRQNET